MSTSIGRGGQPHGGSAVPVSQAQRDALYRKLTWHIIPFLFLAFIVAYIDRVNVSFAKLEMLADLSMSETIYGLGAGMFFIGYFIFEVPSNLILHRVGARVWIARIMVTWSVILVPDPVHTGAPISFYVLRFLLGVAEAGFFPRHRPVPGHLVSVQPPFADHCAVHGGHPGVGRHWRPGFGLDHAAVRRPARHGRLAVAVPDRRPGFPGGGHRGRSSSCRTASRM
jgi:hypothetical protein